MTSEHRLTAIIFIWIMLGVALFFAFGISVFVAPIGVFGLALLILAAGLMATWVVMQAPGKSPES